MSEARTKLIEAMAHKMCDYDKPCGFCRVHAEDALAAIAEQGYAVVLKEVNYGPIDFRAAHKSIIGACDITRENADV